MDSEKHKQFLVPVAFSLLFLFLLLIVFQKNGFLDLSEKKEQLKEAVLINEKQKDANKVLFREVNRLKNDEEFLEQVARKELGMIKSDEIIVKFHSDGDKKK